NDKEYHYTLYYYDQAGNLIQTIPPQGIDRIEQSEIDQTTIDNTRLTASMSGPTGPGVLPEHTFATNYHYNSLNQLVYQTTPDGGESFFAYDKLGRLVVSQNAKQKNHVGGEQFSYTRYDGIGRIIEVGEMTLSGNYDFNQNGKFINPSGFLVDVESSLFPDNIGAVKEEVTLTVYDEVLSPAVELLFEDYAKFNTRNRITGVLYFDNYVTGDLNYTNATFYDYDVHGNVKEVIQDNQDVDLVAMGQNIKKTKYEYDLVSGNVKEVAYQNEEADQFVHQYKYDSDNRITNVFTSKDRETWEQDAKYFYYQHGPLARSEMGDVKVQACDYAYTIQGWIKGVNSENLDRSKDQGKDGKMNTINRMNAGDSYGYSLHYFDGDYQSRQNNNDFLAYSETTSAYSSNLNLFNGNIKEMYTASTDLNEEYIGTNHTWYSYDQLNR
ncbi:MAG: hypothetical protein JNJ99_08395, partial [Crocinitomicaceae bacterium]|nr:hypothetical protein [Crocinitomicaceae bacterium]